MHSCGLRTCEVRRLRATEVDFQDEHIESSLAWPRTAEITGSGTPARQGVPRRFRSRTDPAMVGSQKVAPRRI